MVLESLIRPLKAEMHPGWLLLIGAGYGIIGMLFAHITFPQYASIVMIFFITAASIPLLYNILRYEEDKDYEELEEMMLIKEHSKAAMTYFMLFLGITAALTIAYIVLPAQSLPGMFEAQISTYQAINPGAAIATGDATSMGFFSRIFLNNVRVLALCVVFSFLFGAGAIFILTWNASVIALAIGNKLRTALAAIAGSAGLVEVADFLGYSAQVVFLRYGIHGSLEIIAYIFAGIAGGIISVAVMRHHFSSDKFEHIVIDTADLLLLAIAILFVAGAWEAFITPVFY